MWRFHKPRPVFNWVDPKRRWASAVLRVQRIRGIAPPLQDEIVREQDAEQRRDQRSDEIKKALEAGEVDDKGDAETQETDASHQEAGGKCGQHVLNRDRTRVDVRERVVGFVAQQQS